MDNSSFDALTRHLAGGTSRRTMMRGFAGGLLTVVGFGQARSALAAAEKINICHHTGSASNPWRAISVSENAWPAHAAHGDGLLNSTAHCGTCGNVCAAPENGTALCGDDGCTYVCNAGYEDDGAGGCSEIRNPAINVSSDPTGTAGFCLVQVDLVDFAANTTYPVSVEISYFSDLTTDETYLSSLTTDGDGFASSYPIGAYSELGVGQNWVRATANGITSDWHDIEC